MGTWEEARWRFAASMSDATPTSHAASRTFSAKGAQANSHAMRVVAALVCLLLSAVNGAAYSPAGASFLRAPRLIHRRCVAPVAAAKKKAAKKGKTPAGGGFGKPAGGGGFGKAGSAGVAELTPAERLKKSMDVYAQLLNNRPEASEDDEGSVAIEADDSLVKYAICLRSTDASAPPEFSDWVPVALINLVCGNSAQPSELAPQAVGSLCREVYEAGAQAFPVLRKAPVQSIEYAFETIDSFETHVCDGLLGRTPAHAPLHRSLNWHYLGPRFLQLLAHSGAWR